MYRLVTAFGVTAYLTVLIQPQGSTFFTSRGAPPPRADALAPLHSVVSRTERHSGGAVADVHSSSQESATTSYLRSESYLGSESCAHCHPDDAEIPFDWILAEITGKHGRYDFVLTELARCPNCKQPVTEKTLVEPK